VTLRLRYRPLALDDLDGIFTFIAADNTPRALKFIGEIRLYCLRLCSHPGLGTVRDDLGTGIRVFTMRRRVLVAYRITEDAVVITRIMSSGQDYDAIIRSDAPG
jgi:toxin ParE1/3/4